MYRRHLTLQPPVVEIGHEIGRAHGQHKQPQHVPTIEPQDLRGRKTLVQEDSDVVSQFKLAHDVLIDWDPPGRVDEIAVSLVVVGPHAKVGATTPPNIVGGGHRPASDHPSEGEPQGGEDAVLLVLEGETVLVGVDQILQL